MLPIEKREEISNSFLDYKGNNKLSTQEIANRIGIDRTTVNKYFKKLFKREYTRIAKLKSRRLRHQFTPEQKLKISMALKNKPKPPRTLQHRINLSKSLSKSYIERFGEKKAKLIREKISWSNRGKKRIFKNKELWRKNLSESLKGRAVWNKGKKGLQKAWNKKELPTNTVLNMYLNQNLSSCQIANKLNVSVNTILRILNENNIRLKGAKGFLSGKTLIERFGEEKAELIIRRLTEINKKRKCTWGDKISKGLKKYYQENDYSEERCKRISRFNKKLWLDPRYRENQIKKRREYLKKHPEELERLKKIQCFEGISRIEQKMLNFLKEILKEGQDFYFDRQDITGKTFYRPDFQFPKQHIIIELDGYYKHHSKEGRIRNKIRDYYLKKAGWKIYRFNFYDIVREYKFKEVKNKVLNALKI